MRRSFLHLRAGAPPPPHLWISRSPLKGLHRAAPSILHRHPSDTRNMASTAGDEPEWSAVKVRQTFIE